ncbi:formyltetrahydrofolate deformylase [Dawidia soli]|uniref:Formyltetrahydrofolate deformylase n=1 Tax=Dawidia soli TaxID=2782352 RepID=A0AAP2DAQ8_9BACT|nr:formyltetrahydrofolate deformylase [Dawidia soli]MBT1688548.1 formyltetrahydrofolate deformylase [Dawidia soli]
MDAGILLIHCPDRPGLIYAITQIIYRHQLNILGNGEFVERTYNHFFMRTEFSGVVEENRFLQELREVLPADAYINLTARRKRDIVILATKEHHCLSDLLIRHTFQELNARIHCVISNHQNLEDLTRKFDVPFHYIPAEGKDRAAHEAEVLDVIQQYNPEFLVLAKYMRILSPAFIGRFTNRIINIHHSFLPAFVGANPYQQAYDRGVKIIGATAHFVNDNLDEGPIIAQSVIPVAHTHSAWEMTQAGRDVEKIVLARSLKLVFNDSVFVYRNKSIILE